MEIMFANLVKRNIISKILLIIKKWEKETLVNLWKFYFFSPSPLYCMKQLWKGNALIETEMESFARKKINKN